jgi:methionyl-tRNA formyltransferase
MKIVALGTSSFIVECINGFMAAGCYIDAVISLPEKLRPNNSLELEKIADHLRLKYYEVENINSTIAKELLKSIRPDLIICSWPRIIDREVIEIPKMGVIGSHPTNLPFKKGRHPIHWQIALGSLTSSLTFFWLTDDVDDGNIILQEEYAINPGDDASIVMAKIDTLAFSMTYKIGCELISGTLGTGNIQDKKTGNSLRKRDLHDVIIDFRMNAQEIIKLILSFSPPYPCAKVLTEKFMFNVISAKVVNYELPLGMKLEYIEHGKILEIDKMKIYVKCADFILALELKEDFKEMAGNVEYIHPPSSYIKNLDYFN